MVWGNLPSRIEQMARFRGSDYKWKGDLAKHAPRRPAASLGLYTLVAVLLRTLHCGHTQLLYCTHAATHPTNVLICRRAPR